MKKYLIFSYNISGMGGGQQYVYNKVRFMQNQGYMVRVYSAIKKEIVIKGLCEFEPWIMHELKYPPCAFREKKVEKILNDIVNNFIELDDEILIESCGAYDTQWAELVAEKCTAQHICMNIGEVQNKRYSDAYLEFLYFKYIRAELYGITKESLQIMFSGKKNIVDSANYSFAAVCTNVVDEYMQDDYCFPVADYTIGGIWRTEKEGFVETIIHSIPFFETYKNKKFNLVFIGSGSVENEKKAKDMVRGLDNVNITFLGYMYPIPLSLLKKFDLFISTAGSSRIPMKYGLPSITVTTRTDEITEEILYYPLGILNYTTCNTVVPEETGYSLKQLMEMVLIEKWCSTHNTLGMESSIFDEMLELRRQLDFFGHIENAYYNVRDIKPELLVEKGYAFIGKTMGGAALMFMDKVAHWIKVKLRARKE